MKKQTLLICAILFFSVNIFAQKAPDPNPALTADSLATGNYKDVLNSFFQLTIDKLTGPDKELKFTSTPFAVMAKMDSTLLIDKNYIKYNTLRNINFSFSAGLDSVYKFNGFTSSVKYALINKRDETVSKAFVDLVTNNDAVKELFSLNNAMDAFIASLDDLPAKKKLILEKAAFTKGSKNFDELDPVFQQKILTLANASPDTKEIADALKANPKFNINKTAADIYEKMKNDFNKNLLWTIGISDTTYKDQFFFSNILFNTEVLQGISSSNQKNEVELNIKSALQITDDALTAGRDLKRTVFSFEPGINFVVKTQNTKKSFFEMKFSGSYYHVFNGLYTDEKNDRLTLNSTVRIRIINDIWIPLEIKYDTEKGNFLGVFNVRANFTGLSKLFKGALQ